MLDSDCFLASTSVSSRQDCKALLRLCPLCTVQSTFSPFPVAGQLSRQLSNLPEETIYGGPKAQVSNNSAAVQEGKKPPPRVTLRVLGEKYRKQEPITMVTAYDYPSAVHVDQVLGSAATSLLSMFTGSPDTPCYDVTVHSCHNTFS